MEEFSSLHNVRLDKPGKLRIQPVPLLRGAWGEVGISVTGPLKAVTAELTV